MDHGLREDGGSRGAVTCDVVGLGGDFLGQLSTEIFVGIVELNFLGDGDAVVRDGGGAPLLVEDDVTTLWAERHLDGVCEGVDATLECAARLLVECEDLCHVFRSLLGDDGEDVARVEEQVLLAVVLELGAAVLGEHDDIALSDVHRDASALVVDATGTGGDDLALLGLLLGGVRDHETRSGGLDCLEGLNEDAVLERLDRGCHVKHLPCLVGPASAGSGEVGLPGVVAVPPGVGTRHGRVLMPTLYPA